MLQKKTCFAVIYTVDVRRKY